MTYSEVAERLNIPKVCPGGCGLGDYRHRGSIFLGVIHWRERRMTRRGLFRFLLLASRRNRLEDPGYLNLRRFNWLYTYLDVRGADDYGVQLGIRFPAAFTRHEREHVLAQAKRARVHLFSTHRTIYDWARR